MSLFVVIKILYVLLRAVNLLWVNVTIRYIVIIIKVQVALDGPTSELIKQNLASTI